VPPVLTRTWFHTGIYMGRDHVSDFFAGLLDARDRGEYYREPGLTDAQVCISLKSARGFTRKRFMATFGDYL